MIAWAFETLLWTALLIALVLLVRRPVARWFGPQVAYALWLIPALRLVLPPIQLPAWMRLTEAPPEAAPEAIPTTETLTLEPSPMSGANPLASEAQEAASDASAVSSWLPLDAASLIEASLVLWLIGAAIFLYLRFSAYFRLRSELLEGSRELGREGNVRLVETPGTQAPLAFGVIDKVIALPEGFLAQPDRTARDLALAHEMAHHEGRDLLINILVQPLFALHWFNPLCHYGWLALRRDQEAACDARVVAAKPAQEREAYANLIVTFAAGPNVALAAPMACPVLGEKSIIHRLRSLKMSDTSQRRLVTGRLMLGAAVLALPLTATISYAASEVPAAPAPPAAPVAPSVAVTPPAPPAAPVPPAPPLVTSAAAVSDQETIIIVDPETGEARTPDGDEVADVSVIIKDNQEIDEDVEFRSVRVFNRRQAMSQEDMDNVLSSVELSLTQANEMLEDIPDMIEEALEEAEKHRGRTIVKMECDDNATEIATTFEKSDNTRVVKICQRLIMAEALSGLREARDEIARSREMSERRQKETLRALDRQIERWESPEG